jgi:hypothetical protein
MSKAGVTRRAALRAVGALAVAPTIVVRAVLARSSAAAGAIHVDVAPLRANAGDPTATWVERELPGALARSMAGRIPRGGLIVRIEYLTLGPNTGATVHGNSSPDNIIGVAIAGGRESPVRATTSYMSSPIDQTMIEQSNHDRVSALVQALAYWMPSEV